MIPTNQPTDIILPTSVAWGCLFLQDHQSTAVGFTQLYSHRSKTANGGALLVSSETHQTHLSFYHNLWLTALVMHRNISTLGQQPVAGFTPSCCPSGCPRRILMRSAAWFLASNGCLGAEKRTAGPLTPLVCRWNVDDGTMLRASTNPLSVYPSLEAVQKKWVTVATE